MTDHTEPAVIESLRDRLLACLRNAEAPLDARQVSRQIQDQKVQSTELEGELEQLSQSGVLFRYSPKSPKARMRYWDRDPQVVVNRAMLELIRDTHEPQTAKEIKRQLKLPFSIELDQLESLLKSAVEAGKLHKVSPKTKSTGPRYWDRKPGDITRPRLVRFVHSSEEPVNLKEIKRGAQLPFKLSDSELSAELEFAVRQGELHLIPPKTAKSGPRYWSQDQVEFARRTIIQSLQQKGIQTAASLKQKVRWLPKGQADGLLNSLTESQGIYVQPAVGNSKTVKFGLRPPVPAPYLKDIGKRLTAVVDKLRNAAVAEVDLRRAIVEVVEASGVSLAGLKLAGLQSDSLSASEPSELSNVDLVELMKKLEPAAERGALMTVRVLRQAANVSKSTFDQQAIALAREGRVVLHEHDFPSSLTPAERDMLISDGQGHYFVGLALRPRST